MAEYEEVKGEVEVPKSTGITGFLETIKSVLRLPRVQDIHIDSKGKVAYRHFVREGEARALGMNFDSLMPYAIIRNGTVLELPQPDANAAVAIAQLFNLLARDRLHPTAFVTSPVTAFWDWYVRSVGEPASRDEIFGVPLVHDRMVEDHVLLLCGAYARAGEMVDTQKSYKLVIPAKVAT